MIKYSTREVKREIIVNCIRKLEIIAKYAYFLISYRIIVSSFTQRFNNSAHNQLKLLILKLSVWSVKDSWRFLIICADKYGRIVDSICPSFTDTNWENMCTEKILATFWSLCNIHVPRIMLALQFHFNKINFSYYRIHLLVLLKKCYDGNIYNLLS